MKRTKTKTEITVATRQRITLRGRGRRLVWCQECASTVGMFSPEHAAVLSNTTLREIYRRVEKGEVHFVETREGDLFICCRTFETEKIVIRGDLLEFNWCDACAALTPKVTAEQAAILIGEEIERLYRRAEAGQVHSARTPGAVLLICLKSLSEVPGSEWQTQLKAGPR